MPALPLVLLALIGLSPALLLLDGVMPRGVIEVGAALALLVAGLTLKPGEAVHLAKTLRRLAIPAAVPVLWMIVQIVPLPAVDGISGSLWQSAGTALGQPLWPHISIDPGLTLLALCRALAFLGLVLAAAASTLERTHAERMLYALGAATVLIALIVVADAVAGLGVLHDDGHRLRAAAVAASAYGAVLLLGVAVLAIERRGTRRQGAARSPFLLVLVAALAGLAICLLATMSGAPVYAVFATGCGMATVLLIITMRRLSLGWPASLAVGCVALIAAAVIVSAHGPQGGGDAAFRYAAWADSETLATANRMSAGIGWFGSGGGTFAALYRVYALQDTGGLSLAAPTFAGQIAVEFGPVAWIVFIGMAAVLVATCAAGGLNRGRDFFYPAVGAGLVVTALVLAFCDNSLSNGGVALLLASALGLALSQSASRTL